ncbi:hypothetical protein QTI17_17230 [Variovorax sp. J31P179]|uniref:hypothetical protein n=1 Tax=Variovorax sp. J31P179 TaxID=3053508 RepID=UPI002576D2B3|nr:hypothetical protein [Variovorax sp. J31P179]MDM0082338.1 hypothetical protein [Variovorax sp. J31P179]
MNSHDPEYRAREKEICKPLFDRFPRYAIYMGNLSSLEFAVEFLREHSTPSPDWSKTSLYDAWYALMRWSEDPENYIPRPLGTPPQYPSHHEVNAAAAYLGYELRKGKKGKGLEAKMSFNFKLNSDWSGPWPAPIHRPDGHPLTEAIRADKPHRLRDHNKEATS